jgi:glycerol-3-phosphate acyltransferase PlsY
MWENLAVREGTVCIAAFFLGAIPFGLIAGKLRGVDLRQRGSGNIGATNALRELGVPIGVTVFLLDGLKGLLPVLAARWLDLPSWWVVGAGLCAALGHIFSPFIRFKGGKGVATSLGVLIGLSPLVAGISFGVFLVAVFLTRYISLGSILGAATQMGLFVLLPAIYLTGNPLPYRIFGAVAGLLVIWRHQTNIKRLLAGTESKFGKKATPAPTSPSPTPAGGEEG